MGVSPFFICGGGKMAQVQAAIRDQISSVVTGMGYEFVGCEWAGHQLLRIYIDTQKGVTIDDCTTVSRQLSAMLDVEDLITGRYVLEVSSPGLDRPLFELEHYKRQVGNKVKIQLQKPIDNRRNWVGVIKEVDDKNVCISVDGMDQLFLFSDIAKAHIVADIFPREDAGSKN